MKSEDVVMVNGDDLEEGDWFWDSDGDLNYVLATIATRTDEDDLEYEDPDSISTRYWNRYKKYDGVPDTLPNPNDDSDGVQIHWGKDQMFERIVFFQPVSDEDVDDAIASILRARHQFILGPPGTAKGADK